MHWLGCIATQRHGLGCGAVGWAITPQQNQERNQVKKMKTENKTRVFPRSEIVWSRNLWDSIKLGGIWGVPRSGLVMVKTETGFDLQSLAPLTEHGMPCDWAQFQRQDFCEIGERFAAAGLTFTDSRNLLGGAQS